jgi:hypothetical protein
MSSPRITSYRPHPDATRQAERSVLGAVYAFVLSATQRGPLPNKSGPDDAMKGSKNDRAKTSIQE